MPDQFWPGTNETHITANDVEELRELIQLEPAKPQACLRRSTIVFSRYRRALGLHLSSHRTKLIDGERNLVLPNPRLPEQG